MNISDIYERYQIPPILQEHMFRVAGVGQVICENFNLPINKEEVIATCLLHDMGNIIKFNLEAFPEFVQPEGMDYWKKIQDQYKQKYPDEHIATDAIAKELGVSGPIIELISLVGISKSCLLVDHKSWEAKICCYSDMRVGPYGVISINERVDDLKVRYKGRVLDKDNQIENWRSCLLQLEQQIFSQSKITPQEITEERIQQTKESLFELNI